MNNDLVARLEKWKVGIPFADKTGRPLDSAALLRLIEDCIAALTAQPSPVMVPVEPTEAMLQACCKIVPGALNHRAAWFMWEAMLAAAKEPQPDAAAGGR